MLVPKDRSDNVFVPRFDRKPLITNSLGGIDVNPIWTADAVDVGSCYICDRDEDNTKFVSTAGISPPALITSHRHRNLDKEG